MRENRVRDRGVAADEAGPITAAATVRELADELRTLTRTRYDARQEPNGIGATERENESRELDRLGRAGREPPSPEGRVSARTGGDSESRPWPLAKLRKGRLA